MYNNVMQYVKTCHQCQLTQVPRHKPYGNLGDILLPCQPWKCLSMDYIISLPPSMQHGIVCTAVFMVVDQFTKNAHFIPMQESNDAESLADIFYDEIFQIHSTPHLIISDCGSPFACNYWGDFCHTLQTKRLLLMTYHPQTDGQTEHVNQFIKHYLWIYTNF